MSSEVFFAAIMPATRATEKTSPFSILSPRMSAESFGAHVNTAARGGYAAGNFFLTHVDHPRASLFVQVTELCHRLGFFLH
jgi:hypothetical protein